MFLIFCYAVLSVLSIFAIIMISGRENSPGCFTLIVFLMFCAVNVVWLLLTVPWVGLLCTIVVFPDHTLLLFFIVHKVVTNFLIL